MKRPNEDFVKHLCWIHIGWLAIAVIGAMWLFMSGCASRQSMNKLFYDMGRAQGKIEAMK